MKVATGGRIKPVKGMLRANIQGLIKGSRKHINRLIRDPRKPIKGLLKGLASLFKGLIKAIKLCKGLGVGV